MMSIFQFMCPRDINSYDIALNPLQDSEGSGYLELQILELSNPLGTTANGQCCGGGGRPPCRSPCRTLFRLCLKEYQSNVTSQGSCSFGNTSSPVLGAGSFVLADPDSTSLLLPFTFRWTVSTLCSILIVTSIFNHYDVSV